MVYAVKICPVCGKDYDVTLKYRVTKSKYCSKECGHIGQRGRKNPHSDEWEKKRIEAVRQAAKNKVHPKGYKRPREHTIGMVEGHRKFKENNPEKHREIAIRNLSKSKTLDLSGENSPQWNGGITKESTRLRNIYSARIEKFRDIVLNRDNHCCKQCGSNKSLEVHHIISFKELPEASYLPMNGVTLCKSCHKKTDTFGAKGIKKEKASSGLGKLDCIGVTIPHNFQAYNTIGNYAWTESGVLIIFVSELGDERYNSLVFFHELIESKLCLFAGIKEDDITNFDLMFENEREAGLHSDTDEPGDDLRSPYRKQHIFATECERGLCKEMGLSWEHYEQTINKL